MKKIRWIIGISAVLLLSLAAKGIGWYRWSHLSTAEKAGTITEKLARHLELTEEQKGKVYAFNLQKVQAIESARANGEHERVDWKQLHEDWKNNLRSVLTAEQQQKICH